MGYLKLVIKYKMIALFIPIIVAFSLLTLSCLYYRNLYSNDIESIKMYVVPDFHLIISLMSVWWLILLFSNIISEKGNEVFYLYVQMNSVIKCIFLFEVIYSSLVCCYFLIVKDVFMLDFSLLILLVGEILFMNGIAFLVMQITKNTSIGLVISVVYCIYILKFDKFNVFDMISVFCLGDVSITAAIRQFIIDFGIATILHIAGAFLYKKWKVYY